MTIRPLALLWHLYQIATVILLNIMRKRWHFHAGRLKVGSLASQAWRTIPICCENNLQILRELIKILNIFKMLHTFWLKMLVFIHELSICLKLIKKIAIKWIIWHWLRYISHEKVHEWQKNKKWAFWEQYWGQALRTISVFRQSDLDSTWRTWRHP